MKEISNDIFSIYWWFTVIIVGYLINFSSIYLKIKLDTFLASYSKKRRNKNEHKKRIWDEGVKRLKSNENYKFYQLSYLTFYQGSTIIFLILSIGFFIIGILEELDFTSWLVVNLIATFSMFFAIATYKKRNDILKQFDELMV